MALTEKEKRKIEEEERIRSQYASTQPTSSQKHGVPAILSFFIPGLGQLIKGQVGKGIVIFFFTMIGYMFLIIPGVIIHIWQIVDAYNSN